MIRFYCLVCFVLLSADLSAQRLKYKEIFETYLKTKQYDKAEPLMKRYLAEKEGEPSAFLYMGRIYEDKFNKTDVLLNTKRMGSLADSAVYYYDLCAKNITEKEVSKREEYYEDFRRRDYRTGATEAKMSYVTEEIRDKTEAIRDRQSKALKMNRYLGQSKAIYARNLAWYKDLVVSSESQRQFVLTSTDETTDALNQLIRRQDSLTNDAFKNYRSTLMQMGNSGYDQKLVLNPIKEFGKDGFGDSDFLLPDVQVWDFKAWATSMLKTIEKVRAFKARLIRADIMLTDIREKIRRDSLPMTAAVQMVGDSLSNNGILEIDPDPLPYDMFRLKMAEILYGSILSEGRTARRSEDIFTKIRQYQREIGALELVDSLAGKAMNRDIKKQAPEYKDVISQTYGSTMNLGSYFRLMRNDAVRKRTATREILAQLEESAKWVVDGADSIPAMQGVTSERFFPLQFADDAYSIGIANPLQGPPNGYFILTPRSRKPDLRVDFPIDSLGFSPQKLTGFHALSVSAREGAVFYAVIYSDYPVNGKTQVAIAKVFNVKGDELQWANHYAMEGPVEAVSFSQDTGILTLSVVTQDGSKIILIQKDGRLQN